MFTVKFSSDGGYGRRSSLLRSGTLAQRPLDGLANRGQPRRHAGFDPRDCVLSDAYDVGKLSLCQTGGLTLFT